MKIQVGDVFRWKARQRAVVNVTEVSVSKVKFEVFGLSYELTGSMNRELFEKMFPKQMK